MRFKNLLKSRKKDYSLRLTIKCGEDYYNKYIHPKVAQGYVRFKCPHCNEREFTVNSCSFFTQNTLFYTDHSVEVVDNIFLDFCRSDR